MISRPRPKHPPSPLLIALQAMTRTLLAELNAFATASLACCVAGPKR